MIKCANCGTVLTEDAPDVPRTPCPECGSTNRNYILQAGSAEFKISGATAKLSLITYPQRLIATARRLLQEQEESIATIVACMAAEIAAVRRMSKAFSARGIPDLETPITDLYSGSALSNDRIRAVYAALTNDLITQQPFWPDYKVSAKLRNNLVHGGASASPAEASTAIESAEALIKHLGEWGD